MRHYLVTVMRERYYYYIYMYMYVYMPCTRNFSPVEIFANGLYFVYIV